ncbi:YadA-like family protein [Mesorhizobium sp. SB112]|uniref:YadA-like family protein n=1 Tax=Mesorhizobium sp. SB112 TaxID=3151853 RepID=UPI0032640095
MRKAVNHINSFRSANRDLADGSISDARNSRSLRRRLMAVLRMAHRVLGMSRKRLGLGELGSGRAPVMALSSSAANGGSNSERQFSLLSVPTCGHCGKPIAGFIVSAIRSLSGNRLRLRNAALASAFGLSLFGAVSVDSIVSPAFAGTCVQIDAIHGSSAMGSGAAAPATCGSFSIAIGAGSGATADNFGIAIGDAANSTGSNSVAIGRQSSATATQSSAFGQASFANQNQATALGNSARASQIGATPVGYNAQAQGQGSIAMGNGATAAALSGSAIAIGSGAIANRTTGDATGTAGDSLALGAAAHATGQDSTALGSQTTASGTNSVVVGGNFSTASGTDSTVVGVASNATGARSSTFGANANATAADATALGTGSAASGVQSTAVGSTAQATLAGSSALGYNARATQTNATAIGLNAQGSGTGSVALGANSVAAAAGNVAIGLGANANSSTTNSSGIAIGQTATSLGGTALGAGANAGGIATAIGAGAQATADNSIAIGTRGDFQALASGNAAFAVGNASTASGVSSIAIGRQSAASQAGAIAMGQGAVASGANSLALGGASDFGVAGGAQATGASAVALGIRSVAGGAGSVAIGDGASASAAATNGVAMGNGATVTSAGGVTLGASSAGGANNNTNGVIIDPASAPVGLVFNNAGNAGAGAVSVGSAGNARQIQHVADGSADFDAVNIRQLSGVVNEANTAINATNASVENLGGDIAISLGGGSTYDPATGSLTTPVYIIGDGAGGTTPVTGVGGAITNLDGRVTNNEGDIANLSDAIASGTVGLVQQSAPGVNAPITVGAGTDGDTVAFNAQGGATRTLTGLTAGEVSATSTDAINGSQLFGTSQSIAIALGGGSVVNPDGTLSVPTYTIQGGDYNNAGDAFAAVDGNLTDLNEAISSGTIGLVQQSAPGINAPITVGAGTDGDTVAFNGLGGITRTLTGLTAGEVSATSTDAINGSQLFGTSQSIAIALGGGSVVNPDGTLSVPTYTIQGGDYNNAGDAFAAVDGNLTDLNDAISSGTVGLVQQSAPGVNAPITVGAGTDGDTVAFNAQGGATRTLTGLTDGEVSATSTDAINGSQLNTTNTGLADTAAALGGGAGYDPATGIFTGPTYNIQGGSQTTVGGALTALDDQVKTNTGDIANLQDDITSGNIGLVRQDATTRDITVAAQTDGDIVRFNNSTGGTRVLTGVTDGEVSVASLDAINGSQLYGLSSSIANSLGGGSIVNPNGSITGPTYNIQGSTYTSVFDSFAAVNQSLTDLSNAGGGGNKYFHANSTGADSQAVGQESVAVGPTAVANGDSSVAMGNGATTATGANGAVAIGQGATANNANDVALGAGSQTQTATGTAGTTIRGQNYDFAGTAPVGTVSVGDAGAERTVTNVAAGRISADSTDAINGSQLHATNSAIENLEGGLGELDQNAVKYDTNPDGTKKNSMTLVGGDPNAPVLISNVATGVANNDAVNVGQLKDGLDTAKSYTDTRVSYAIDTANSYTDKVATTTLSEANNYTDQKFGQLNRDMGSVRSEARQAAAIGLAAASLRYDDNPGKVSVALGGGVWRGEGAAAFGAGYTSDNGKVRANLSATTAGGHWGAGAGLSFTLN